MNRTVLPRGIAGRAAVGALVVSLFGSGAPAPVAAQYMPSQTPKPPPFFAIQNARIVTGTGSVIENGTVVIGNGLIESVGANVTVPGDAWVIDGSGLTVYPGLFDALTQVGLAGQGGDGPAAGGGGPSSLMCARSPSARTAASSPFTKSSPTTMPSTRGPICFCVICRRDRCSASATPRLTPSMSPATVSHTSSTPTVSPGTASTW